MSLDRRISGNGPKMRVLSVNRPTFLNRPLNLDLVKGRQSLGSLRASSTPAQPTDGSTVSVNSREGCVTKCRAKFLNSSDRLSFARSPAKPLLTFVYTHYSSARYTWYTLSKETHRISQRYDTFNTQFPKLTSIRCKFLRVEAHMTKHCCYVMMDMIGHAAKYRAAFSTATLSQNSFRRAFFSTERWGCSVENASVAFSMVAGHFVTRSFRHNLRSFRHSQFVTPELPNQRRFGCPALYYYHDYTMGQSSKQLQRLFACFKDWTVIVCIDNLSYNLNHG